MRNAILSLIHKIRTKAEITRVLEDEGEEEGTEIFVKEPKGEGKDTVK